MKQTGRSVKLAHTHQGRGLSKTDGSNDVTLWISARNLPQAAAPVRIKDSGIGAHTFLSALGRLVRIGQPAAAKLAQAGQAVGCRKAWAMPPFQFKRGGLFFLDVMRVIENKKAGTLLGSLPLILHVARMSATSRKFAILLSLLAIPSPGYRADTEKANPEQNHCRRFRNWIGFIPRVAAIGERPYESLIRYCLVLPSRRDPEKLADITRSAVINFTNILVI